MNKKQKRERMKIIFPVIYEMKSGFSDRLAAALFHFCSPAIKFNLLDFKDGKWFLHNDAMEYFFPKPKVRKPRAKKPKEIDLTKTCPLIIYYK